MPKQKQDKPLHGIPVKGYDEFREYITKFAEGKFPFLMVIGSTSLGKTEIIKQVIPQSVVCDGALSVYQFFGKLGDFLDWTFVLDDLPTNFYRESEAIAILKSLTNATSTSPGGNVVRYDKASVSNTEIVTKSRVILLANSWPNLDPNVKALEARGITLMFEPTNYEVHKEVARWFGDTEVFDFLYGVLPLMERNHMRLYTTGETLKAAGMDWQSALLEIVCGNEATQMIIQLQGVEFTSENKRCAEFAKRMNCSERTYWRLKKRLADPAQNNIGPNPKLQPRQTANEKERPSTKPGLRVV